jgi:hypothetical protein
MADGPSLETFANNANSLNGASSYEGETAATGDGAVKVALVAIGLAMVAAGIAFAVIRSQQRKADPTTERIQQLIDEANRLLKQLDEKQPG